MLDNNPIWDEVYKKYRIGHKDNCCQSCIDEENMGYGDTWPKCCCKDKRSYDEAEEDYERWKVEISYLDW